MSDSNPAPVQELTPVKLPFIFGRTYVPATFIALVCGGLAVVLLFGDEGGLALGAVLVGLLLVAAVVGAGFVAFGKEHYEVHDTFIRCRRGGVVSDQSTELDVRNITHVKQHLPWLRFKLFGVGDIMIESAGSAGSEVRLKAIADPDKMYADIRTLMQRNGYALEQGKILHRESPDLVGVLVEMAGLLLGGLIAVGYLVADLAWPAKGEVMGGGAESGLVTWLLLLFGNVVSLGGLALIVTHFLDLKRRTYTIYDDAVVYEEGFLDRHNAFIPYENIADAEAKRTLVDQILGLYDVRVSCQGGGSEVKFRRLRRGQQLMAAISGLVQAAREKPALEPGPRGQGDGSGHGALPEAGEGQAAPSTGVRPPKKAQLVPPDQAWTAELTMSTPRALLSIAPLIIFPPAFLAVAVGIVIKAMATRYSVRPSSVGSAYRFLTVDEREFAYDKITGLVVRESIYDRFMDTMTISLWSIGSPMPLEMTHIRKDQVNLTALRRQVGIPDASPSPAVCTTAFSAGAWARANLFGVISLALSLLVCLGLAALVQPAFALLLGLAAAVVGAHFAYRVFYFSGQQLTFHDDHLRAQTGRLIQRKYFVQYPNVKKVVSTRYPGGELGRIQFFVAGEHSPAYANKGKGGAGGAGGVKVPYSFTAHYIEDIEQTAHLVDDILLGRVPPAEGATPSTAMEGLREAQPAQGNALFRVFAFLILCFPLLPALPFVLPWVIVSVRRKRYVAEAQRVIFTWGVLYKSRASVLYNRIDTLRQGQGALNKIFSNGKVTVMTAGSSRPDLILGDLSDHQAFYDVVRRHYGQSKG